MNGNQIVLFESNDREVTIPVVIDKGSETVWLTRNEMAALFDRDVKTIGKHINNALKEELSDDDSVVAKFATTAADGKRYQTDHYSLDMILPIGYRLNLNAVSNSVAGQPMCSTSLLFKDTLKTNVDSSK